jgi:DNA-binding response OmpR family regulator
MVVDDERDILAILKQGFEDCGFLADGFTNPDRALKQFARDAVYYDLVITGIRMPGMSGYELAARIREASNKVKIVLMTAFEVDQRAWPPGYT